MSKIDKKENLPTDEMAEGRGMRRTLFAVALTLFAVGTFLILTDKVAASATTYAAGIVSLVFVFLSKFKRFKGFGIEAELLEKRVEEANVTIKRLRAIALPMAEMLFTIAARMGRWGSALPHRDSYRLMESIQTELQKNGVSQEELESAKVNWHYFNMRDLAVPITMRLGKTIQAKIAKAHADLSKVPSPINQNDPDFLRINQNLTKLNQYLTGLSAIYTEGNSIDFAERIESAINSTEVLDADEKRQLLAESRTELDDLKYYEEKMSFRNLERWFKLDEEKGTK
jgi:hypothetical protein